MTERFTKLMEELRSVRDALDAAHIDALSALRSNLPQAEVQARQLQEARITGLLEGVVTVALVEFDVMRRSSNAS